MATEVGRLIAALDSQVLNDSTTIQQILEEGVKLIASLTVGLQDSDGDLITHAIGGNANVQYESAVFSIRDYCWCSKCETAGEHADDEDHSDCRTSNTTRPG